MAVEYKVVNKGTQLLTEQDLNDLGAEGWRLVEVVQPHNSLNVQYLFIKDEEPV
jgi:hypothetical protein